MRSKDFMEIRGTDEDYRAKQAVNDRSLLGTFAWQGPNVCCSISTLT